MSNNPYVQVALTYVRRPFSSWSMGLLFVLMLLFFASSIFFLFGMGNHHLFAMLHLTPFVFLFLFLVAHAKDQFADARAHLTPGFRRVHGVVAGLAAVLFAVFLPALFTWLLGWHSVGFVAIIVSQLGTILWLLLLMSNWFMWIVLVGEFGVLFTESGREYVHQLVIGNSEPQAVAILVVGAAFTLIGAMRLFRLNEDMPEYRWIRWDKWVVRSQTAAPLFTDDPTTKWLKDFIAERQMAILTRHARQASASWWSRICRWQAGMFYGWSLWLWILYISLVLYFIIWWMPTKEPHSPSTLGMMLFMWTFMPLCGVLGAFLRRIPMLGHELLMPVDRKTYVRQLGTAASLSILQLWGGMVVALILWCLLMGPRPLPYATLASGAIISAAFQVITFAVMVWIVGYRSTKWLAALMFVLFLSALMISQMWWVASQLGQPLHKAIYIAIVIAPLGLLIAFDAYRRWLKADFD